MKNESPEERIKSLEGQLAFLAGAAMAVVHEAARINNDDPWPIKYRAPFGAITHLSHILESLDYLKEIGVSRTAAQREIDALTNEVWERLGLDPL